MSKRESKPPLFNRELSWLEFDRRVLEEALDTAAPTLERLKFLAITASNLDEFFMVRVGSLQTLLARNKGSRDPSGMTPNQQLAAVASGVHRLVHDQYRCYRSLVEEMERFGLRILTADRLEPEQNRHAERVFEQEVFPLLTPLTLDADEEFPRLAGLTLHLALRQCPEAGGEERLTLVPIPKNLPRFIVLPSSDAHCVLPVELLIQKHQEQLVTGCRILESRVFRVARNADLSIREDLASDLLAQMESVLEARRASDAVRMEIDRHASPPLMRLLRQGLEMDRRDMYRIPGPLDLSAFMTLASAPGMDEHRYEFWKPQPVPEAPADQSIFEQIARRDILLFTPYQSFDPVLRLVTEAADDPDVLAIKLILYRTSKNSPIVAALARAAEKGKAVTALVELKARFDEARNIEWARALERAGVQVIYGIRNLKTHAKLCIVARREQTGVQRYVHVGTGNYNEVTARLYSDVHYITRRDDLAADASQFFNAITARTEPQRYLSMAAAPLTLRTRLLELIEGEAERSRQGQPAHIFAKINSLADPQIVRALYKASQAGVRIDLSVRGICCLRPGVRGWSENIRVVSVVDRFLEHARILVFHRGGAPLVCLSSADWMPRNLDRRIELMVPIPDVASRKRLLQIARTCMRDTVKGRELHPDGSYRRITPGSGSRKVRSQQVFHRDAIETARLDRNDRRPLFEPHRPLGTDGPA